MIRRFISNFISFLTGLHFLFFWIPGSMGAYSTFAPQALTMSLIIAGAITVYEILAWLDELSKYVADKVIRKDTELIENQDQKLIE